MDRTRTQRGELESKCEGKRALEQREQQVSGRFCKTTQKENGAGKK
jgi:hypothetical protein